MSNEPTTGAHVFLHIGTMKTGTSFLQQVLDRNAGSLARDGALYANGSGTSGTRGAIREALDKESAPGPNGPWSRLSQIARDHNGSRVIISSELISFADAAQAERIVRSFDPNPVTVIITARDLVRLLPSAWQNKVKHGKGWSFDGYVSSVIGNDDGPKGAARSFWHHHDLGAILDRWVAAAGAENIVVIPVPGREAGPDALWERFASVTGLHGDDYDLTQDRRSNLSLGYAETELLRLVSRRLRDHAEWPRIKKVIQRLLANEVLRPDPRQPASTEKPSLTPEQYEWAALKSRELADHVKAAGVRVEGSLDELVPRPMTDDDKEAALAAVPPATPKMFIDVVAALVVKLVEAGTAETLDGDGDGADAAVDDWDEHEDRPDRPDRTGPVARASSRRRRARRGDRAGAPSGARRQRLDPDVAEELDDIEP